MRKITLLLAIMLGTVLSGFAQENFSIRAGYKMPLKNITKPNDPNTQGFEVGLNYDLKISENFCFRPGLSYSLMWNRSEKLGNNYFLDGYKTTYPNVNVNENSRIKSYANYLEIPLRVALKKGNFDFEVGPYVSFELAQRNTLAGEKISKENNYKKFDLGFKGSFGYNIMEKYYIGISYENGVINNLKDSRTKDYTQNLSFNLGYRF